MVVALFFILRSGGEEFLKSWNLIQRTSEQRRRVLGCLGCQWAKAEKDELPSAYGYRMMQCTRLKSGTVYPLIGSLADAGVVRLIWDEPTEEGERITDRILPADTSLGQDFAASLIPYGNEVPNVKCTSDPPSSE